MNFLRSLNPYHLPNYQNAQDDNGAQREIILQFTLYITLFVGTIAIVLAFLNASTLELISAKTVLIVAYLVLAVLAVLRTLPYMLRASIVVGLIFLVGINELLANGVGGSGVLLLLVSVLMSNILFRAWVGSSMLLAATGLVVFTAIQMVTGSMPAPEMNDRFDSTNLRAWFSVGAVFIIGGSIIPITFMVLSKGIRQTIERHNQLTKQIEEQQASLEQRVHERAADLRNRLAQFEVASEIAREISLESNLQSLLEKTVRLIGHRFHYYHVGIFLNDDRNEYTILRAAAGQAGQQMIERNHRLKIGEIGIVGNVVSKGEARIAMDVNSDIVHYKNPFLPDTRSEMALPLRYGGQAIGALDVQSTDENAFTQEDIKILQTVADQLAIALAKSQQVEQLQRSVQELEASQANVVQKAWQGHLKTASRRFGYHYHDTITEASVLETEQSARALSTGQVVMTNIPGSGPDHKETVLAIPIKLRSQVLGVIDIHFQSASVSPDLIALIEATVDRLAISLENARLLEEIQYRAQRERVVGEISSRVRTASDVDSILRITAQEIGRSLGVSEVMVQLRSPEQS